MAKKLDNAPASDFSTSKIEQENNIKPERKARRKRKSRDEIQRVSAYLTAEEYSMLDEMANDNDETLTKTISRAVKFMYSKKKK